MKKQIAILATIMAASAISAFGQGYVLFGTSKSFVYDDFTTPGTGVVAPGNVDVAFLWAATGTADPLGSGTPTTGASQSAGGAATITSMLSGSWQEAANTTAGNYAVVADNNGGIAGGGVSYNGGSSFALYNSAAGNSYEFIVVGWNTQGGTVNDLATALSDGDAIGWTSGFTYATGATSGSTVSLFTASGATHFGVAAVPEPTTLALAGLGGLSMLFLRRRKA